MNVSDRPLSLATHLDRCADFIERESGNYDWTRPSQCNCGMLARSITDLTRPQLSRAINDLSKHLPQREATWVNMAELVCPMTGRPEHEIFAKLHDAGFRYEDYRGLEYLSHPEVVARCGWVTKRTEGSLWWKRTVKEPFKGVVPQTVAANVVQYCRTWAKMIREYRAAHETPVSAAELAEVERALEAVPVKAD
jgi:hypothetical protein